MKVLGVSLPDMSRRRTYLEELGLEPWFSSNTVDNNTETRSIREGKMPEESLETMLQKLQVSVNKYYIMRVMSRISLVELLYLLDKDQLIVALHLFPKAMLLRFMKQLKTPLIIKMLLSVIPIKDILEFMPPQILFNILNSERLQLPELLKQLEKMPLDFLRRLMHMITEKDTKNLKEKELLSMYKQLKKPQILDGLKRMPVKEIFEFIMGIVKQDPKVLEMIPKDQYLRFVEERVPKPLIVEMFRVLPEDMLIGFLSNLTDQSLALAASQLDDNIFERILANSYPGLVQSLIQNRAF